MKIYYNFNLKRIYRDKSVLIPIIIFILGLIISFSFNVKTSIITSYDNMIRQENDVQEELVLEYKNFLTDPNHNKVEVQKAIDSLEREIQKNNDAINLFLSGNWSESYKYQIDSMNDVLKNDPNLTEEVKEAIKIDLVLLQELSDKNIKKESEGNYITGYGFLFWSLKIFIPIFLSLILCVILSNLFTKNYKSGIDLSLIIPYKNTKLKIVESLVGFVISISIMLISLFLSFILGTLFDSVGANNYPIMSYDNGDLVALPLNFVVFKSLILQIMGLFFLVLLIQLISILIKTKLNVLFLSFLCVLGPMIGFQTLEPIKKISHLLPTTYLYSVDITTGMLRQQTQNNNLTYNYGTVVLFISIILLFILIYFFSKIKSKNINQHSR